MFETETPEEREIFSAMEQSSVRKESIRQMDKYQSIMEELTLARVLIRELGDRLAKLEKTEPVQWGVDWGKAGDIPCVSIIKRLPDGGIEVIAVEYAPYSYTTPPQRTWVGLTNDEINNLAAGCHLGNSVQDAIYKAVAKLMEKNT